MKKLMEILMELDDSIDWENETALIDGKNSGLVWCDLADL